MRLFFLILAVLTLFAAPRAQATADRLPKPTMALLVACQDATNNLQFDLAESLATKAIAAHPLHPLPRVYLQMTLLARIQESIDAGEKVPGLYERFESESTVALHLARAWETKAPDSRSQLYLGSSLGASGLVKLLRGHYMKAHQDGQAAAASLRASLQRDPGRYEAYLGLGQYNYYCGRMAGLLRFLARLKGDIKGGIAMLETCGLKGGYAAVAARISLARIYSLEETNFELALPYVLEMRGRYPQNYAYVQYALATARGLGMERPEARSLLKSVFRQWDQGWRPPLYSELRLERVRLELAKALDPP